MRYLEMRRHSKRIQPNEHLSQEGVELARRIGAGAGPFDLVVAMPPPRMSETAVAMGFAVGETYEPVDLTEDERRSLSDLLTPAEMGLGERAGRLKSSDLSLRYLSALHQQWARCANRPKLDDRSYARHTNPDPTLVAPRPRRSRRLRFLVRSEILLAPVSRTGSSICLQRHDPRHPGPPDGHRDIPGRTVSAPEHDLVHCCFGVGGDNLFPQPLCVDSPHGSDP